MTNDKYKELGEGLQNLGCGLVILGFCATSVLVVLGLILSAIFKG